MITFKKVFNPGFATLIQAGFLLTGANLVFAADPGVYQKTTPEAEAKVNVKPGTVSSTSLSWFKMGDLRLINNDWGSREAGCPDNKFKIYVNADTSFGWEFDRKGCGGDSRPDYPELELGIHPFGTAKEKVTTPDYSSTTLLPIQIKDVKSMNIHMGEYKVDIYGGTKWNLNFEMWFTDQHPVTGKHNGAYSELMAFFGHYSGYYPENCDGGMGIYQSASNSYKLCYKSDNWGGWRYLQSRKTNPSNSFSGTYDVKAALDWLVNNHGHSKDLWISRLELGTEIGDNTKGKVTMKNIKFEINGKEVVPEFYKDPVGLSGKNASLSKVFFPANHQVVALNMLGQKFLLNTGSQLKTASQLGKNLPAGVYTLMLQGQPAQSVRVAIVK